MTDVYRGRIYVFSERVRRRRAGTGSPSPQQKNHHFSIKHSHLIQKIKSSQIPGNTRNHSISINHQIPAKIKHYRTLRFTSHSICFSPKYRKNNVRYRTKSPNRYDIALKIKNQRKQKTPINRAKSDNNLFFNFIFEIKNHPFHTFDLK